MRPIYAHCPHCGFPAVVGAAERLIKRFCRQCRGTYVPQVALEAELAGSGHHHEPAIAQRQRFTLRARIRQQRRAIK